MEFVRGGPQVHFPDSPLVPGNGVLAHHRIPGKPQDPGRRTKLHNPVRPKAQPDILHRLVQGPGRLPLGQIDCISYKIRIVRNGLPGRAQRPQFSLAQQLGTGHYIHCPALGQFIQIGIKHRQGGNLPVLEFLEHRFLGNPFFLGNPHQAVVFHHGFNLLVGFFHLDALPVQVQGTNQSQTHQCRE